MPDYTTNYNLKKPLGTENYNVEDQNGNMDIIDSTVAAHLAETAHIPYAIAAGAANAYTVVLDPVPTAYTEGMAVALKINIDNTGASTINVNNLGAKTIKKANGNDVSAGNLKAGSVYTLRYNGVNFILQGEGGEYGTAVASDVLTGKTIGTEEGIINGTMPNRGAVIITPSAVDQAILAGYHNGAGKVNAVVFDASKLLAGTTVAGTAGTMPNRGAYNITPGVSNIAIPAGFHSGVGVVYGDSDLVASNIKSGVTIFGVTGTLDAPITYYYNLGAEGVSWVAGNSVGTGTQTKYADHLNLYINSDAGDASEERTYVTDIAVNLTGISKLNVDWEQLASGGYLAAFIVSTSKTGNTGVWNAIIYDYQIAFARRVQQLDVSVLTGNYYIRVHAVGWQGIDSNVNVYRIWGS